MGTVLVDELSVEQLRAAAARLFAPCPGCGVPMQYGALSPHDERVLDLIVAAEARGVIIPMRVARHGFLRSWCEACGTRRLRGEVPVRCRCGATRWAKKTEPRLTRWLEDGWECPTCYHARQDGGDF